MIVADAHEHKYISCMCDSVAHLDCDYIIYTTINTIRIERKTAADLYRTVAEGRLEHQLKNVNYLLIDWEGFEYTICPNILHLLNDITIKYGILILHANDRDDVIRVLRKLERGWKDVQTCNDIKQIQT